MTVRAAILALLAGLCGQALAGAAGASAALAFGPFASQEFQPRVGQEFAIPYVLDRAGRVTLTLYTGDGDVVRTLVAATARPGAHQFKWDGRDDRGQLVPNEAYHPVIRCECGGSALLVDTRARTGGVVLEKIRPELAGDGSIGFDLPQPARTLVRVGFKGGAMMRAIDTWSPRSAGRVRVEWDGYDQSGVERLLGQPGLTVLVTAYTLPDRSIIVSGGADQDYFAYRQARAWPVPTASAPADPLQRDGKRLARQASLPRTLLQDPRVTIQLVGAPERHASGAWRVKGPVTLRVDMPQEDKWLVQQSLYEVGFFLDHQFLSEEETGYTPITWRWDPAGVRAGEHTMTVNISGFWGQVGVASIRLWVDGE